ncbi:MAG: hypothetical protein NVS2B16_37130 [Chloroflexota bacterium]
MPPHHRKCGRPTSSPAFTDEDVAADVGLDSGLLNGPDAQLMGENVQRNIEERRIIFAMGVFERV